MRIYLFLLIFLISPSLFSQELDVDEICESYQSLTLAEVSSNFKSMQLESSEVSVKLGEYQTKGVSEDDPGFSAVAVELGTLLGKLYTLCTCNEPVSETKECQAQVQIMDAMFNNQVQQ